MWYFLMFLMGVIVGFGVSMYLKDRLQISFDMDGHKTKVLRKDDNGEITGRD